MGTGSCKVCIFIVAIEISDFLSIQGAVFNGLNAKWEMRVAHRDTVLLNLTRS